MSDALNIGVILLTGYRNVYLIVFIYQLGVRYGRHGVTVMST